MRLRVIPVTRTNARGRCLLRHAFVVSVQKVIGFSVDYTIHLSDAYLESRKETRGERTRDMLANMAPAVLSG